MLAAKGTNEKPPAFPQIHWMQIEEATHTAGTVGRGGSLNPFMSGSSVNHKVGGSFICPVSLGKTLLKTPPPLPPSQSL